MSNIKLLAAAALVLAAARPAMSQGWTELISQPLPIAQAPNPKPVQPGGAQDDSARFKAIMQKVEAGQPISKADQAWALDRLNKGLQKIDSGEAEKEIMTAVEAQVDDAIKTGKLDPKNKPMVMDLARAQVQAELAKLKTKIEATVEKLKKAKTN